MRSVIFIACLVILSGCASIFVPKKQRITVSTASDSAIVYLDNEEFGKGASIRKKTVKTGTKQIIVKNKNYKDNYVALVPTHRPVGFWVCQVFNLPFDVLFVIPTLWDMVMDKNVAYDNVTNVPAGYKMVNKTADEKYIEISKIKLDIKDKNKDLYEFQVKYAADLAGKMQKAVKDKEADEAKAQLAQARAKKKKNTLTDDADNNKLLYDDTKFSYNIFKTLKQTGFIDTVNRVFSDNNNTLVLEGSIKKVYIFHIITKDQNSRHFYRTQLFLTWYLKNTYGEVLDSIDTRDFSGDFVYTDGNKDNAYEKMFADAVDISYLNLYNDTRLKQHIRQDNNFNIQDPVLNLTNPKSVVTEKANAADASVIVKTGRGHGSGFAITNDGYIITNYHVVSGRVAGRLNSVKIITGQGTELEGTVVRYNKFRDLALIKVNYTFDRAFKCSKVKSFKSLQDVYTIGAPKSIELGQSISSGVISNERKNNNNNLLQLGMSVNSGNSGGPLFDAAGNLHGVIVSKLVGQSTEGVSFAVPGYLIQDYLKIEFK